VCVYWFSQKKGGQTYRDTSTNTNYAIVRECVICYPVPLRNLGTVYQPYCLSLAPRVGLGASKPNFQLGLLLAVVSHPTVH